MQIYGTTVYANKRDWNGCFSPFGCNQKPLIIILKGVDTSNLVPLKVYKTIKSKSSAIKAEISMHKIVLTSVLYRLYVYLYVYRIVAYVEYKSLKNL